MKTTICDLCKKEMKDKDYSKFPSQIQFKVGALSTYPYNLTIDKVIAEFCTTGIDICYLCKLEGFKAAVAKL